MRILEIDRLKRPNRACCRALTAECLSCDEGISVQQYCLKNPNKYDCPQIIRNSLSSFYTVPSYPFEFISMKTNYIPRGSNQSGLKLYLNNNRFSKTSSAKGSVGWSSLASRAYRKH